MPQNQVAKNTHISIISNQSKDDSNSTLKMKEMEQQECQSEKEIKKTKTYFKENLRRTLE